MSATQATESESLRLFADVVGRAVNAPVPPRFLGWDEAIRYLTAVDLVVRPFGYPLAARYWEVAGPRLAVQLHAVVGGTPAYRRFVNDDSPQSLADFDKWVLRAVLNSASPLFRAARYLLEEAADVPGHRALPLRPGRGRERQRDPRRHRHPGCSERCPARSAPLPTRPGAARSRSTSWFRAHGARRATADPVPR
ncbi:MAG: hypothetical protein ACRDRP_14105 [Pseudonocardiaceae bacterium]